MPRTHAGYAQSHTPPTYIIVGVILLLAVVTFLGAALHSSIGKAQEARQPPAPLVVPAAAYAQLCYAPEWWLVKASLNEANASAAGQTLEEAKSVFCAVPITPVKAETEGQRRADALNSLLRLASQLSLRPPPQARLVNLRLSVLMTILQEAEL